MFNALFFTLVAVVAPMSLCEGGPVPRPRHVAYYYPPLAKISHPETKIIYEARIHPVPNAIVRHSAQTASHGTFQYGFDTENGISTKANGLVKNLGTKDEIQVMQGSYSYTGPDGVPITTNWVADEFGFRAEGAHLPTPPPIPEEIARSIEYNRAHPQPVGIEAA